MTHFASIFCPIFKHCSVKPKKNGLEIIPIRFPTNQSVSLSLISPSEKHRMFICLSLSPLICMQTWFEWEWKILTLKLYMFMGVVLQKNTNNQKKNNTFSINFTLWNINYSGKTFILHVGLQIFYLLQCIFLGKSFKNGDIYFRGKQLKILGKVVFNIGKLSIQGESWFTHIYDLPSGGNSVLSVHWSVVIYCPGSSRQ